MKFRNVFTTLLNKLKVKFLNRPKTLEDKLFDGWPSIMFEYVEQCYKEYKHPYRNGGYGSYYEDKKEGFSLTPSDQWGNKQKKVYELLKKFDPRKVLDFGAGTGWFSLLAESLGSRVVSTDIDKEALYYLYKRTRSDDLNILPLYLPFESLIVDEKKDLFSLIKKKLRSEFVLCLALVHHLIFVYGLHLDDIMKVLSDLTEHVLILEYVDLKDENIQKAFTNPSSFVNDISIHKKLKDNLDNYAEEYYNLENIIKTGYRYFSSVTVIDSHPHTRKLLVFQKK